MASSDFVDYVRIFLRSGKGGAGSTHLRREKFVPKGGPDGGDGGRGGHIILRGTGRYRTLIHLKYRKHIHAENGGAGGGRLCNGSAGEDMYIDVPPGTVVKNAETGDFICEIIGDGEEKILLKGGKGGLGNANFKSSTNRTPLYSRPGEPGIEGWYIMELKILADVGLVGFPNAGKSTLLSVMSAAKPEIADYPFTTLKPNLGIVGYRDGQSFAMADIPGIIEGAHQGKGLGLRFLRHIERNSMLLFTVPADSKDIRKEYEILIDELKKFNSELSDKARILAVTKSDMLDAELKTEIKSSLRDIPHIFISSITGEGITDLKDMIRNCLDN